MRKVAFVTVSLQHYRLSFYEKLTQSNPDIEWTVYHGLQESDDGRPAYKGETNFSNVTFTEKTRKVGPFKLVYNVGLLSKIKSLDPDLIVLPGIAGNISNRKIANWARRKNKKIVFWTCGWEPGYARGVMLFLKNILVSRFFKKGTFHLTYSTKANTYIKSMGIASDRITTCFNGIEIDHLLISESEVLKQASEIRRQYDLNGHITFLYVGGLIEEKRIDLLVRAFSELRKTHSSIKLLIIGDGPYLDTLISMLNGFKDDHIKYLGRIVDGVDKYFAAVDCLVMPGIGGLALNQAMFWGKLCIVSDADGTEDDLVVHGTTGFRFERDDLPGLQSAMNEMIILDKSKRELMSKAAKNIILKHSNTNNMVEIFSHTIGDLLK